MISESSSEVENAELVAHLAVRRPFARRLCELARDFYAKGWMQGTSGNLSARLPLETLCFLVTSSGLAKGALQPTDLLSVDAHGQSLLPSAGRPSAECSIHGAIYQLTPAQVILHVHSPAATRCSTLSGKTVEIRELEMLKGLELPGPFSTLSIPIVDNAVQASSIAQALPDSLDPQCPGFLVRGHGIYAWGESFEAAQRHLEIFEFLLSHESWSLG